MQFIFKKKYKALLAHSYFSPRMNESFISHLESIKYPQQIHSFEDTFWSIDIISCLSFALAASSAVLPLSSVNETST